MKKKKKIKKPKKWNKLEIPIKSICTRLTNYLSYSLALLVKGISPRPRHHSTIKVNEITVAMTVSDVIPIFPALPKNKMKKPWLIVICK